MEIQGYNMPDELYYEENHYWLRLDGDHLVMGMDDFAQQMAGEIVYVQLPFEGKKLKKGKKFAQVESGKWLGKVFAKWIKSCGISRGQNDGFHFISLTLKGPRNRFSRKFAWV